MRKDIKFESFGDSFLDCMIGVCLAYLFFFGDPDVVDAIRQIVLKFAGM